MHSCNELANAFSFEIINSSHIVVHAFERSVHFEKKIFDFAALFFKGNSFRVTAQLPAERTDPLFEVLLLFSEGFEFLESCGPSVGLHLQSIIIHITFPFLVVLTHLVQNLSLLLAIHEIVNLLASLLNRRKIFRILFYLTTNSF